MVKGLSKGFAMLVLTLSGAPDHHFAQLHAGQMEDKAVVGGGGSLLHRPRMPAVMFCMTPGARTADESAPLPDAPQGRGQNRPKVTLGGTGRPGWSSGASPVSLTRDLPICPCVTHHCPSIYLSTP